MTNLFRPLSIVLFGCLLLAHALAGADPGAGAPAPAAEPVRNVVMTANLGQIYDRLPRPEADAEVERLLDEAGYDAGQDVLIDLGGFSAPTQQYIDIQLLPFPVFDAESSYACGALAHLQKRGLRAASLTEREALLDPAIFARPGSPITRLGVGNLDIAGREPAAWTQRILELATSPLISVGATASLAPTELLFPAAANRFTQVAYEHAGTKVEDIDATRTMVGVSGDDESTLTAESPRSLSGSPLPFVSIWALDGTEPTHRTVNFPELEPLLRDAITLTFAEQPRFGEEKTGRKLAGYTVGTSWVEEPGREEPVPVTIGVWYAKGTPDPFVIADAMLIWRGGPVVPDGSIPPATPRFILHFSRDPSGLITVEVERPLKLGLYELGTEELARALGLPATAAQAEANLVKLGGLGDLVQPVVRAMTLMERAAQAQGVAAPTAAIPATVAPAQSPTTP